MDWDTTLQESETAGATVCFVAVAGDAPEVGVEVGAHPARAMTVVMDAATNATRATVASSGVITGSI